MRILVVEDDATMALHIVRGLSEVGHRVDHVSNGRDLLGAAADDTLDMLIVDRMLPGMDGLSAIQAVRAAGNQTPVLILSALGDVDDRVHGLKAGGDDYLVKPFAFPELIARIEALARRAASRETMTSLKVHGLTMNLLSRQVIRDGVEIDLKPREFQLLENLMRNAGHVVTRAMLLEAVWHYHFDPQTNVIDVHISRLRQKLDKDFEEPLIHTVRGIGYVLGQSE